MAAVNRDPLTAPHAVRNDTVLAAFTAAVAVALALLVDHGRAPDALGWTLLLAAHVPLAWRRRRPLTVLLLVLLPVGAVLVLWGGFFEAPLWTVPAWARERVARRRAQTEGTGMEAQTPE